MSYPTDTEPNYGTMGPVGALKAILKILWQAASGDVPLAVDTGGGGGSTSRTVAISTETADGTVAAGKRGVQFIFSPDFVGTIDAEAFSGATDAAWEPPALSKGEVFTAISYTISAGSARLTTVT